MKKIVGAKISTRLPIRTIKGIEDASRHLHLIGIIGCYMSAASRNKQAGTIKTKSSAEAIEAEMKEKLDEKHKQLTDAREDTSCTPAEREFYTKSLQFEIKEIKAFMKRRAEFEPFDQAFNKDRLSCFSYLKTCSRSFKPKELKLNLPTRQGLLTALSAKICTDLAEGNVDIQDMNLLHRTGLEVYLTEILRRHKNSTKNLPSLYLCLLDPVAKTSQIYNDALMYRRFYCIEDYANNLLDYLSEAYGSLKLPQKVRYLIIDIC